MLAQELATLDVLSDGRLDVAIGAGWNEPEYGAIGLPFDPVRVRQARLAEAITVLKGCFGDGPFSFAGEHYTITDYDAYPKPVQQPHPPFFIGGGGRTTLELAAREARHRRPGAADPVAGSAPTRASITWAATEEKIGWVREAAGDRFDAAGVQRLPVAVADRRHRRPPRRGAQGHRPDEGADGPGADRAGGHRLAAPLHRLGRAVRREVRRAARAARRSTRSSSASLDELGPVVERLAGT